jgi:hypothetical protein
VVGGFSFRSISPFFITIIIFFQSASASIDPQASRIDHHVVLYDPVSASPP